MNKHLPKSAIPGVIMASLLLVAGNAHAAKKKPVPAQTAAPKADAAAKAPASGDPAYEQWLKKYGAYDRIAEDASLNDDGSGTGALKRAEAQLLQGTPRQALKIIEEQKPYDTPDLEIRRLWIGGNAHRALGDAYKAVVWYSQAAKLMEPARLKAKLASEHGLDALWVDVWRRQFWAYAANPSASREALELTLRTLLEQAVTAWGNDNFWTKAKEALAAASGDDVAEQSVAEDAVAKPGKAPKTAKPAKDAPLAVTEADRERIAQAMAAASLEKYAQAKGFLAELGEPALREFWSEQLTYLETGKAPEAKGLVQAGFAKAAGFWNANLLAAYATDRSPWFLGSKADSWKRFKDNLAKIDRAEAQATVDKELNSLLLSDEMSQLLRSVKLALTLEDGDMEAARKIWDGLDKRKLPLSLRLAGGLAFQEDVKHLLPQEIGAAAALSPAMTALLAAGGTGAPLAGEAPFWTRAEVGRNSTVNKAWPLDRLLVLADWQARWVAAPGMDLARRSAFLFPDTAYGYDCLAFLTQRAVENRNFQLAEAYLARMDKLPGDKKKALALLSLKGKLERESGKDEEALATYRQIAAMDVEMDPRTRLDLATFLQLKNDLENGRKQLLILWKDKDKLPRPMQAEILFWLGEGEHSLRNYDAALDYYLRLAYQYPKEPMWPTVAMYRSAMIYEIKGNYETAKKLLNSVIATADTKEAQEAARNRLTALEAKSGKPTTKEGGEPVYPF
jgi:hypothetical protein